jgi:2-aminoethylphosphonate-pyruvate transaminase
MTDPFLLTPGPLTTTRTVKEAMLRDFGSRDGEFIAINERIRRRLPELAGAAETHVAVPVQGSGTFAVEAMIGSLVPRDGRLLVLVNGAYGKRIVRIAEYAGRIVSAVETPEDVPVSPDALDAALTADSSITHVAVIHCETTTGILNPLPEIAGVAARHGKALLVDAMSSFGALPLSLAEVPFTAFAASSNKCLQGAPGFGFVIVAETVLAAAKGNAHALVLDLHDQHKGFVANGQWRFTPPTHVLAAFDRALTEHAAEGGIEGRGRRYARNGRILVEGMRTLGFETLLPDELQAPVIVTFKMPADPRFAFTRFYDALRDKGYVIYPGKLTVAESFRMGCIGALGPDEMNGALAAVRATLTEMGVASGRP